MASQKSFESEQKQQVRFLKRIDFFNDFDENELKQFLAVSRWVKVPENTLIIKENTLEKVFYILVKGTVSVFKTDLQTKGIVELTTLATGACFGEMAIVGEVRRTAGVVTTEESYILVVEPAIISTSNVFLQVKFYKRFCEILVTRLIMANERMVNTFAKPRELHIDEGTTIEKISAQQQAQKNQEQPAKKETRLQEKSKPDKDDIDLTRLPTMPDREKRASKTSLKRRIHPDLSLPVNVAVIALLSPYLTDDIENTQKFTELINLDPILSCKVLQLANSSFFRRTCAVASVPHALVTVGVKHIQEVVSETIKESRETKAFSRYKSLAQMFWQHSIVVGRIAEMLKDVIRVEIPQSVYLAGLLHDVGILPLDNISPQFYPQLLRNNNEIKDDLSTAEKEFIGIDHGKGGSWLAEKMGLPYAYQNVMQFHHYPESTREDHLLVALIHLADLFAISHGMTICGPDCRVPPIAESFAWVMIQDQHRPFLEVNIFDFINSFNVELTKNWQNITNNIPL